MYKQYNVEMFYESNLSVIRIKPYLPWNLNQRELIVDIKRMLLACFLFLKYTNLSNSLKFENIIICCFYHNKLCIITVVFHEKYVLISFNYFVSTSQTRHQPWGRKLTMCGEQQVICSPYFCNPQLQLSSALTLRKACASPTPALCQSQGADWITNAHGKAELLQIHLLHPTQHGN